MGFALGLGGLAALVAWSAARRPRPARPDEQATRVVGGRESFEQHCASCHEVDEFDAELRGPRAGAAMLDMLELLVDHGDSSDAEDRAIARYLLERGE